ncbi:MAG: site-2 protease family protein [Peptococcaceae bacterium]|nr:site-2 protease family protein [Peptococcaceae bacterium]
MIFNNNSLAGLVALLLAVLTAITCHEVAHGYMAYRLGDPTAKNQGRLTLNPIKHLDPIGALLMLVAGFGWAKPVPVNPFYFEGDRNKGMMLVSVAGPVVNLIISFLCIVIYNLGHGFGQLEVVHLFLLYSITLNVYLAVFNLIPIPPLDGSKILAGFLPKAKAYQYLTTMEKYGFLILMVLILFNITDIFMVPIANVILNIFIAIASILG